MHNNTALTTVFQNLQIEKEINLERSNAEQWEILVAFIDDLIQNDFNRLLRILYRVDISEGKLKIKLAENKDVDVRSAELLSQLLIEREIEKIASREKYR